MSDVDACEVAHGKLLRLELEGGDRGAWSLFVNKVRKGSAGVKLKAVLKADG